MAERPYVAGTNPANERPRMIPGTYSLNSIGTVDVSQGATTLQIDDEFRAGLSELSGYSYAWLVWWCHELDSAQARSLVTCEQPYRDSPAEVGVFATRSPARPNPIAMTPVRVLAVDAEQGTVTIPYVDADPGSPILDIKPYVPSIDRIRDVDVPAWAASWPEWYEDSASFDWSTVFVNAQ